MGIFDRARAKVREVILEVWAWRSWIMQRDMWVERLRVTYVELQEAHQALARYDDLIRRLGARELELQGRVRELQELNRRLAQTQIQAEGECIEFALSPIVAGAWARAALHAARDPSFPHRDLVSAMALSVHLTQEVWQQLEELASRPVVVGLNDGA